VPCWSRPVASQLPGSVAAAFMRSASTEPGGRGEMSLLGVALSRLSPWRVGTAASGAVARGIPQASATASFRMRTVQVAGRRLLEAPVCTSSPYLQAGRDEDFSEDLEGAVRQPRHQGSGYRTCEDGGHVVERQTGHNRRAVTTCPDERGQRRGSYADNGRSSLRRPTASGWPAAGRFETESGG